MHPKSTPKLFTNRFVKDDETDDEYIDKYNNYSDVTPIKPKKKIDYFYVDEDADG